MRTFHVVKSLLWAIPFGTVSACAVLTVLKFTGSTHELVVVWPVTGILLGLQLATWKHTGAGAALLVGAGAAGVIPGCLLAGLPLRMAAMISGMTVLDLAMSLLILGQSVRTFDDLKNRNSITRFVAVALFVPALSGTLGSRAIAHFVHVSVGREWIESLLANSLGIVLFCPSMLRLTQIFERGYGRVKRFEGLFLVLFTLVICGIFLQAESAPLFLLFPLVIVVIFVSGLEGALRLSLITTAIAWSFTELHHGPIWFLVHSVNSRTLNLQLLVWACVATAVPTAALLDAWKRTREAAGHLADELKTVNERFQAFMDHSPTAAFIKDADGRMLYYNRTFADLFSISSQEWIGKDDYQIWPKETATALREFDLAVLAGNEVIEVEEERTDPNGNQIHWKVLKFPFSDATRCRFLACIGIDVSKEKSVEAQLREKQEKLNVALAQLESLATTDGLTGLANRRAFDDALERDFSLAKRNARPLSLALLDIDHFKDANDIHGHRFGDWILGKVGALLRANARSIDLACRIGGDEFAILFRETSGLQAIEIAARIRQAVLEAEWGEWALRLSIGVAEVVSSVSNGSELLAAADEALYQAKKNGRDQIAFAGPRLQSWLSAANVLAH